MFKDLFLGIIKFYKCDYQSAIYWLSPFRDGEGKEFKGNYSSSEIDLVICTSHVMYQILYS